MDRDRSTLAAAVLGGLLALGIAGAGLAAAGAFAKLRAAQRFVTVKGLAEREVDADVAIWPLTFKEAGDDLGELQKRVDAKRELVAAFLLEAGFQREEIGYAVPRIQDRQAEPVGPPRGPRGTSNRRP